MTDTNDSIASSERKALYLLADSQLLFWNSENSRFISSLQESLQTDQSTITKAAYIGAANGDNPEFYDLFVAAMDNINTHQSRMISSAFSEEDREFIESADLILLAGGDVDKGWDAIKNTGLDEIISNKYYSGAVIIGISSGAMQLGMGVFNTNESESLTETLKLIPYFIGVNDEKNNWFQLKEIMKQKEDYSRGFGILSGGGMIYHPDMAVEPLRTSLNEFQASATLKGEVATNILLPPESA